MAKKTGCKAIPRETVNQNRNHQPVPDEITLRDEILELKRQVMVLKRTNEQYLVKLRKYEDETKRKDKQLEQLLDPRKNAGVTKVLSTKGAAILMNLKDQNNTLIQMILNKDLHIRRLVAELKMSKLYASTRKNDSYKAEITRLRNLLIKSQEMLKENVEVQQRTRSICVSGNSLLEFSSSSDQSSPRYLDDLRMTVLGLESHIQHSNDLLAKKNQEISHLTDELNILRKFFHYKTYKNKAFDCDPAEPKNRNISTPDFTCKWSDFMTKTTSQRTMDAFEKNGEDEGLPHSAPAAPTKWLSSDDSTSNINSETKEVGNPTDPEVTIKSKENCEKFNKTAPALGKSLFHSITTDEILNEEKVLSNSRSQVYAKEMWKRALKKFRELKKLKTETLNGCDQNQEKENKISNEFLCVETTESFIESYHGNPENSLQEGHSSMLFKRKTDEKEELLTPNVSGNGVNHNGSISEMCQNSEKNCNEETESSDSEKSVSKEETDNVKEETQEYSEPFQSVWNHEEMESKKEKSFREIYHQNLDSSFDSDSSYSMKPEVRQVQVEVQINSFSLQTDSDQSDNSISENYPKIECGRSGENCVIDFDFNDDDDVIVREK